MQAFAQVPDFSIFYGPDSYMGANIKDLFQQMTKMTDEEIAAIHPEHSQDSIRSLLPRLHYFQVKSLACFVKLGKNLLRLELDVHHLYVVFILLGCWLLVKSFCSTFFFHMAMIVFSMIFHSYCVFSSLVTSFT